MNLMTFKRRLGRAIGMDPSWFTDRRWLVAPNQPSTWEYRPPYSADELPDHFFVAVGFVGATDVWLWRIAEQIETHVLGNNGVTRRTGVWIPRTDPESSLRALLKPGDRHPLGVPFELALIDDPTAFEEALAAWQAEGGVLCDS